MIRFQISWHIHPRQRRLNRLKWGLSKMCGIFGVRGHPDSAALTHMGLYSLQHRGQESAGIVAVDDNGSAHAHRTMGLVSEGFGNLANHGHSAIGHTRYSTAGS